MPIKLHCGCGRTLTLRDEAAGKKITCPACHSPMIVPMPDDEGIDLAPPPPMPASRYGAGVVAAPPLPVAKRIDDEPAVELEDGPGPPRTKGARAIYVPPEPWYYKFLEIYAKLWLGLGLVQFGCVLLLLLYGRYGRGNLQGPGEMIMPLLISAGVLFALALVAAPILLAVDAARNLRMLRWTK